MKHILLPLMLSLSACSNCHIPYGEYMSYGGNESLTTLDLNAGVYTLSFEHWQPSGYENRSKISEQGKWTCIGSTAEISTKNGTAKAELQNVGGNPLGLPVTTKALVFKLSGNDVLSKAILYPQASLK